MEEGCRYMRTAQLSVVMISLPPVRYSEGLCGLLAGSINNQRRSATARGAAQGGEPAGNGGIGDLQVSAGASGMPGFGYHSPLISCCY